MPSTSAHAWLWEQLKQALPADEYDRIREGYLARVRAVGRAYYQSEIPADAPKQKRGRKKGSRNSSTNLSGEKT